MLILFALCAVPVLGSASYRCSSEGLGETPTYSTKGLPFPAHNPVGLEEEKYDDLIFDPAIHLQLEDPEILHTLLVDDDASTASSPFPVPPNTTYPGLAYSAPFRVLSDAGILAVRGIVNRYEHTAGANERTPKRVRGLGYRSAFIRNLTYAPELLEHLSKMANLGVWPHDMHMNIAQTNFGQIGHGQKVDEWHQDSVDYVMVLLMSDTTDMVGGELQVARVSNATEALLMVKADQLPSEVVATVQYPGAGHAIFMQGSKIAHTVTSVLSAKEPRLSLVNSYQTLNPFRKDKTVYTTFRVQDPPNVVPTEMARHAAWRVQGQLGCVIDNPQWGPDESPEQTKQDVAATLRTAAAELLRAADLITGVIEDERPYKVDEDFWDRVDKVDEVAHATATAAPIVCAEEE